MRHHTKSSKSKTNTATTLVHERVAYYTAKRHQVYLAVRDVSKEFLQSLYQWCSVQFHPTANAKCTNQTAKQFSSKHGSKNKNIHLYIFRNPTSFWIPIAQLSMSHTNYHIFSRYRKNTYMNSLCTLHKRPNPPPFIE